MNHGSSDMAELPEWSLGDFWIYDMHFDFTLNDGFYINGKDPEKGIKNMRVEIVEINEDDNEYLLDIKGYLLAQLEVFGVGFGTYTADVEGTAHVDISTLSIKDFEFFASGEYKLVQSRRTEVTITMVFTPSFDFFDFPIESDEDPWNVDTYGELSGHIYIEGLYDEDFSADGPFENETITYNGQEQITVPAGTFDCYYLSGSLGPSHGGWSKLYYSPDVKYLVKVDEKINNWEGVDAELDLSLQATNCNIHSMLNVTIHRIKALDPIEFWPGDQADWSYRLSVDDGDYWIDEINDNYANDDDDHTEDISYFFNLYTLTPRVNIKVWERDDVWPDGPDLADVSSEEGGGVDDQIPDWDCTIFKCKYDIVDNTFVYNDTLEIVSGYFVSSGEYPPDGSGPGDPDENDAEVWFKISDDYEPPIKPNKPEGPTYGKPGEKYTYTTSAANPDENQRFYKWGWGDGTYSDWLGPYNADETIEASHTWAEQSTYAVRVKAKDVYDVESKWSDPLSVNIPRTRQTFQQRNNSDQIVQQFLNLLLEQVFTSHPVYTRILNL